MCYLCHRRRKASTQSSGNALASSGKLNLGGSKGAAGFTAGVDTSALIMDLENLTASDRNSTDSNCSGVTEIRERASVATVVRGSDAY
jgi:hypothetical protein